MKKFKFKICGIRKKTTIECCLKNKIEYFGLVFYQKSPRYISIDKSIELIKFAKDKPITPVGVFFNENINDIIKIIKKTKLDHIQLHGNENINYIDILKNQFNIKIREFLFTSSESFNFFSVVEAENDSDVDKIRTKASRGHVSPCLRVVTALITTTMITSVTAVSANTDISVLESMYAKAAAVLATARSSSQCVPMCCPCSIL